jgi:hypothetical protein
LGRDLLPRSERIRGKIGRAIERCCCPGPSSSRHWRPSEPERGHESTGGRFGVQRGVEWEGVEKLLAFQNEEHGQVVLTEELGIPRGVWAWAMGSVLNQRLVFPGSWNFGDFF